MFKSCAPDRTKVVKILMDGGYAGENSADAVEVPLGAEAEIAEQSELHYRSAGCRKNLCMA